MKTLAVIALAALALAAMSAEAGSTGSRKTDSKHGTPSSYAPRAHNGRHVYGAPIPRPAISRARAGQRHGSHSTHRASGVARDSHGRIKRSTKAKDEFRRSHPCPSTGKAHGACPGYVIDHVKGLKHGGADTASNMQWQTTQAAKAKDKVE